jgi:outer membrane lipoprotein-sorting protein
VSRLSPPRCAAIIPVGAAIATAAVLAAAGPDAPPSDSAAAWASFARSCFAGVDTVEASVAHEVVHPLGAVDPPRRGTLYVQRGGRFRLEYGAKGSAVVVSDGRAIRAWDPANRIVVEEPFEGSALSAAFALALGGKGRAAAPAMRWLGGGATPDAGLPSALAIELPGSSPSAVRIAVALAPTCPSLTRIVIADRDRAAIRITLGDVRLGVRFPGRTFAFTPPRGVRVVRP